MQESTHTFEFSKAIKEIEEINVWFQKEDLNLEEALTKYKRGLELITACKKQLSSFHTKVKEIKDGFGEEA
jgi:exodeoxyribonuclease VII small subunit